MRDKTRRSSSVGLTQQIRLYIGKRWQPPDHAVQPLQWLAAAVASPSCSTASQEQARP